MKPPRDTVILGGTVVDGGGGEPFAADVLIRNGKIKAVGKFTPPDGADLIDASGRLVTPGFIDIHRHCDYAVFNGDFGKAELAQGITAAVSGNCGLTPYPVGANRDALRSLLAPIMGTGGETGMFADYPAYAARLSERALPLHVRQLIGSCSVRVAVKGLAHSPFTPREMDSAAGYIKEAIEGGALGLSFGLMYEPEYYSARGELVALAKAAASRGGVLTCHIRGEGDSLAASVAEAAAVALEADIPLQISHFKACGSRNWGRTIYGAIEIIESKKRQGAEIHADFYPYTGGATSLLSLLPPGFIGESESETHALLESAEGPERLERMLEHSPPGWDNYIRTLGFERIIIASVSQPHNRAYVGRPIPADDPYAFICRLMAEESCGAGVVVMSMAQADVDTVARLPYTMVISDALYPDGGSPHPRSHGAFPRVLRDMVRERKVLSLQEAIYKMTALPAAAMRMERRGLVREGYWADLCVFGLANISDNADWKNPALLAAGIDAVLVEGRRI